MNKTSPVAHLALGIGHALAGVGFFFSIIGVFGLIAAIGSLLLFIVIAVVSIFQTAGAEN
jgi:hypothetical protein